MSASFKINLDGLKRLQEKFDDPTMKREIEKIPREKAVAAIIGQAIADNFAEEGPGWAPLKIRKGRILQKTGLLKKSVTVPDAQGNLYAVNGTTVQWGTKLVYAGIHQHGGTVTAKNAKKLFIPLSKKAQEIGPQKDKESRKSSGLEYGKDFILKKSITIPARPFLILHDSGKRNLYEYVAEKIMNLIQKTLKAGG